MVVAVEEAASLAVSDTHRLAVKVDTTVAMVVAIADRLCVALVVKAVAVAGMEAVETVACVLPLKDTL